MNLCSSPGQQHTTCSRLTYVGNLVLFYTRCWTSDSRQPASGSVNTARTLQMTQHLLLKQHYGKCGARVNVHWHDQSDQHSGLPDDSFPNPAMLHLNPGGSCVWRGGRQTVRTDGVFTAQPPSAPLIFSSAKMSNKATCVSFSHRNPPHLTQMWLCPPMSLLKLLYFGWMIIFSTVNFCSLSASVSLMALFPRNTVRSSALASILIRELTCNKSVNVLNKLFNKLIE